MIYLRLSARSAFGGTGQREISLADTADWQAGDDSHLLSFSEGVLRTMAIRLLCDLRIMINDFCRPADL